MAERPNPLGEFLRARRELVTPEQAGIPVLGVRRVPGLKRDESVTYLLGLAADKPKATRRRPRRELVPPSLLTFIATLGAPAFIEGRYLDVLAANALAAALSPRLVAGRNRLRDVFLDPDERELFVDWDAATEELVAAFRQSVGTETEDPRFIELVGQLSLASPRFRRLWGRHDIGGRRGALMRFDHPSVGELVLNREKLIVGEAGTEPHRGDLSCRSRNRERGQTRLARLGRPATVRASGRRRRSLTCLGSQ